MITWSILLIGFSIFLGSLCLHIIIWRLFNPRNYTLALLLVFVIMPLIIIGIIGYIGTFNTTFIECISISLLHLSLAFTYIMSYPAIQAGCPSLSILLIIGDSMPQGITSEELKSTFTTKGLVWLRLKDLVDSNLAVETDGCYTITGSGRLLLGFFMVLRRFLGLPIGEG